MKYFNSKFFLILFCVIILVLCIRGLPGNPDTQQLNTSRWKGDGPFELSPERGRFALTYSLIEDHSFQFSNQLGEFTIPDAAFINGHYASLFAQGVSVLVIPGYILGKLLGISQVGTFAVISIFGILNFWLIRSISIRLGANSLASSLAGLIYLFASPAFTYAVNLYEHQISTFLILMSIYLLIRSTSFLSLAIVFFLCGCAIPVDNPNFLFMFPIGLVALGKLFNYYKFSKRLVINIKIIKILAVFALLIPMLGFLWLNKMSYGNPFQLAGTVPSAPTHLTSSDSPKDTNFESQAKSKVNSQQVTKNVFSWFKTRNILNGFYIHILSPDRGILYFTPIMFFAILGAFEAYKRRIKMTSLMIFIIMIDLLFYSMWGDPWGGWAFGSRYMIPAYALMSIFIALLLTYWRKKIIFIIFFFIALWYSVTINTMGALTSSANPPQVQILSLEQESGVVQKYTFERNWDHLLDENSRSFFYQTILKNYLSTIIYYKFVVFLILLGTTGLLFYFEYLTFENKI